MFPNYLSRVRWVIMILLDSCLDAMLGCWRPLNDKFRNDLLRPLEQPFWQKPFIAVQYSAAVQCSAVQCSAVHWIVVTPVHWHASPNPTYHKAVFMPSPETFNCFVLRHCTVLHSNAVHCTAMHCTVVHCKAVQCTALCGKKTFFFWSPI